jgi:hypothetical protein
VSAAVAVLTPERLLSESGLIPANADPVREEQPSSHDVVVQRGGLRVSVPHRVATKTWFEPLVAELANAALDARGSSYPRRSADMSVAREALNFAIRALRSDVAPPSLAPLNSGAIQLEWHQGGLDVEVIVGPDEDAGIWIADLTSGEEWTGTLDEAVARLRSLADRLV